MAGTITEIVSGCGFVEAPRWRNGRLYFSDFGARRVYSTDREGNLRQEAWVPGQPSGLGFAPDGALLIVAAHEGHVLRHGPEGHLILADVGSQYRGPLNDMLTLPNGNSYVSALPSPVIGSVAPPVPADGGDVPLFLVRPDGSFQAVAEHLKIPNGIAVSGDGSTLFVAEVFTNSILAFDIQPDGTLSNKRVHADLGEYSPDGIAIDSKDRIWIGCPFAGKFIRVDASGKIDDSIEVPGVWNVACAMGDNDDELWLAVSETSIEDYLDGRSRGSIRLWQRS